MRTLIPAVMLTLTLGVAVQARAEMPKSEADFIATIQDARTVYGAQETKAKKTALVKEMVKRWKAILPDSMIHDWVGKIVELGQTKGGRIHLAIRIGDKINLMTWEKPFLDFSHGTLIGQKSPLYPVVSAMKPGEMVRFDGKYQNFVNLNERAKVYDTDLIVAFTALSPGS
ncbi:MAG TPA: hypothetical protein VH722_19700 [Alphaproteobacteria bacterium]|jgi:hypothetical protein|nr:hypothetical protein [Alphaproteobacteria bacterium]